MAKKKNKNTFASELLPDFDELEDIEPQQPVADDDEEDISINTQKSKKGKKDKKGKKNKNTLPDLDELEPADSDLQWNEEDDESPTPTQKPKGGKKAAKGKKGKKLADEDLLPDLDDLQVDEEPQPKQPEKTQPKGKKGKKGKTEDLLPDLDDLESDVKEENAGEEKLTKKELKRLKKEQAKKSEKEKKQQQPQPQPQSQKPKQEVKKEEKKAEKPKNAPAPKTAGPPKKLTGALAAIKKQQEEKLRRERELQEMLEREEQERLEAEKILQAKKEEEKRKREEEKRRIEEEIAEQKRLGIYMTEQQKAKIEKQRQQMIAMLERQGKAHLIDQILAESAAREKHGEDKKRRFIERKKNKDKKKKESKQEKKPEEKKQDITDAIVAPKPVKKVEKPKKKAELSWDDMLSDEEDEGPKEESIKAEKPTTEPSKPQEVEEDEGGDWDDEEEAEEVKEEEVENDLEYKQETNTGSEFRNPICCVLGHVDTGKTKILDRIRSTNVQGGEAGGITQQIGATYVPVEAIKYQTKSLPEAGKIDLKVPGLLIIDTPGHESFTNLRSRGTSLCDVAILVVDILHGLERQTLESIELLRKRKCPFVVALNKIDTVYGWKSQPNAPVRETLKKQSKHTVQIFEEKVKETITLFAEQGLNACLYYKNRDFKKYVSLVPTSAVTGEGIPDLLMLMCALTQNLMASKITYKSSFECTVLEVKVIEGHGHTVDVILSNGVLKDTDTIVLCGLNGPIVTKVRALLTPKPLREMRVKGDYIHHKEIRASMGIKIAAQNLDQAVPGTQLLVVRPGDDIEELKEAVMEDFAEVMSRISTSGRGVYVASSTLGALEALLSFLKDANIPVAHISIGPVHKRDVTICMSMKEKAPEYAMILAFDVPITKDAQEMADKEEITIFSANIIYHLFDRFTEHQEKLKEEKKQAHAKNAIWPCVLSQTGDVFHAKQPITIGVVVEEGELRIGTPCVAITAKGEKVDLGACTGIQHEKKSRQVAKAGEQVAVSFDSGSIQHGRHISGKDMICSKIHRGSIEAIKAGFKEELLANNQYFLKCIVRVKGMLGID